MGLRVGIYSTPWIGTYAAHIGSYSDRPDGENEWIEKGLHNENYRYQKTGRYYWEDRCEVWPALTLLWRPMCKTVGRMGELTT